MGTEEATPKRRWRPSFSLLTLVLGVVFVSACIGLWFRRAPWAQDRSSECPAPIREIGISPNGDSYFVEVCEPAPDPFRPFQGSGTYLLSTYDTKTGTELFHRRLNDFPNPLDEWQGFHVHYVGGRHLLIDGWAPHHNAFFFVTDARTGKQPRLGKGRTWPVRNVSFSSDGRKMLYLTEANAAVLDLETGHEQELALPDGFEIEADCYPCALSSDGKTALVAGGYRDASGVSVFDAETGRPLSDLRGYTPPRFQLALSPDGQRAVLQQEKGLGLYAVESGKRLATFKEERFGEPFSPDSQRLLLSRASSASVFDANTGTRLLIIAGIQTGKGHSLVPDRFSRDGGRLLSEDQVFWDAADGRRLFSVRGIAHLSPDERWVSVTQKSERTLLLDAETGRELFEWPGLEGEVELSPDGSWLLLASGNRTEVWLKRRPEYWWGLAWLPEFWVAYFSGGALLVIAARRLRIRKVVKQEAA